MKHQLWGERNSIKRTIMIFSMCFVLITLIFGGMIIFQSHMAARQYDDILQNIVSLESSKELVEQLQISTRTYAQTHSPQEYQQFQTYVQELTGQMEIVSSISRDPASLLAVDSIQILLAEAGGQFLMIPSSQGALTGLTQAEDCYQKILYLLNRVQTLEANYASAIYPRMNRNMVTLTKVTASTLILMVFAAIVFSADFHARVYIPIRRLVGGVREISKGNFHSPDIELDSSSEMNYLASAINGMKADLSNLITAREEKLNAERLLKETQFMALQSQVNPHFLFNVLGMATAMALEEEADKTLDIVESISYMLRYSLQSMKTTVTLRDEMKMVQRYLFLQHQRFGDRIRISSEFDERIPDVPIPGMTVQPMVENAMVHGCEKASSGGWLKISCVLDEAGGYAVVTVQNNGGTLSPQQLAAFRSGENMPHGGKTTGIGLSNVRDRMQYYYDREGLMDCQAMEGDVTVVTLRYPISGKDT